MTMFVEQDKTRKEIAEVLKVRENTVGKWATEGNWESLRTSRLTAPQSIIANIRECIDDLVKKRRAMEFDKNADPVEKARLTDEISKLGKVLSEAKGEGDVTLNARLTILGWSMDFIREKHPDLHNQIVDVELELIEEAAKLHR